MFENKKISYIYFRLIRFWNKQRNRFARALGVSDERKTEIYIQLSKSATLSDFVYWLQLLFSAGIATLGLVLNSTAVIIGAMLISPLMGPILSLGLALATGDLILGLRSFINLTLSTLAAVGFAFILVALLPFKESTPEIQARIAPNTLDLGIALFSGAIGSIALCREVKGVVTSIPGVAIAVALMPPLCVVGYGVGLTVTINAAEGMANSIGGGLLYLTNLVAITFTAMIVFFLLRMDTRKVREKNHQWRSSDFENLWWLGKINKIPALKKAREIRSVPLRLAMILVPLLAISVPLSQSFGKLRAEIQQKQEQNRIKQITSQLWQKNYGGNEDGTIRSFLDEVRITEKEKGLEILIRVFDNIPYGANEKENFRKILAENLNRPLENISFQLIEIPTSAMKTVTVPPIEKTVAPPTMAETKALFLGRLDSSLNSLTFPQDVRYIDYQQIGSPDGKLELKIFYLSQKDLSVDAAQILSAQALTETELPDTSFEFERISPEAFPVPFLKGSAQVDAGEQNILDIIGSILQNHPRLNLAVELSPDEPANADTNTNTNTYTNSNSPANVQKNDKQIEVKNYFTQKWSIAEERLVFGDGNDIIRLMLNE